MKLNLPLFIATGVPIFKTGKAAAHGRIGLGWTDIAFFAAMLFFLGLGCFGAYMSFKQHDADPELKAKCEAAGGVFGHGKHGRHYCK